jgi:RNA-directed DNA polymerase
VISPLLSNIYLNEVDAMLERAQEVTRNGRFTYVEYARYADDLVILVDGYRRHDWLLKAVDGRLREEFAKLDPRLNEAKSRIVDLAKGEAFGFLGFDFRLVRSLRASGGRSTRRSRERGGRWCRSSRRCSGAIRLSRSGG